MTTKNEVVDSLTTQGKGTSQEEAPPQTIIMPVVPTETQFAVDLIKGGPIIPANVDGGAEGVISPKVMLSDFAATPAFVSADPLLDKLVAAEQLRQKVQAEAMVNLAIGVTLMTFGALTDPRGNRVGGHIKVRPKDLEEFQRDYTVTQEVQSDGGFIISVRPREV